METKKEKCKEDCACKIEGKTHSFNDGCGCPEHNGEKFEPQLDKQQEIREWKEEFEIRFMSLGELVDLVGWTGLKKEIKLFIEYLLSGYYKENNQAIKQKLEEVKKEIVEKEYCSNCCSPKKFCTEWGKYVSALETDEVLQILDKHIKLNL